MNEEKVKAEDAGKDTALPLNLSLKRILIVGVAVALITGGLFLFNQVSSSPGCAGEGACMLYFYTEWWEVCKLMSPIVYGLGEKYGRDFKIVRVDVDDRQGKQLAREYGCIGQPAFVLFDRSGEQVRRLMGAQTKETFEQEIERILAQNPWRDTSREAIVVLSKRRNQVLLAVAGLVVVGFAIYFLFFAGAGYIEGRPTFKYFRLDTWPFCEEMNPIVDGVKKSYGRKINFVYVEMGTAKGKEEARDEGVMGTPTFLLLNGDSERVFILQGVHPRPVLEQHLDSLLARE